MTEQPTNPAAVCQTANFLGFIIGGAFGFAIGESPILFFAVLCLLGGAWAMVNMTCKAQLPEIPRHFNRNMAIASGVGLMITVFGLIITTNIFA